MRRGRLPEWGWFRMPVLLHGTDFVRGQKVEFSPNVGEITSVKIILGAAGDHVRVTDDRMVYVNDVLAGRAKERSLKGRPLRMIRGGIIPDGHYFMLGTHADSYDSRYHDIGLVAEDDILARVWALPDIAFLGLDGPMISREDYLRHLREEEEHPS